MIRSYLFVPADSEKKCQKALAGQADALIFDLEDAVHPASKAAARDMLRDLHRDGAFNAFSGQIFVRVNGLESDHWVEDVELGIGIGAHGLVLPKAEGAASVLTLSAQMGVSEARQEMPVNSTRILAIATETAQAMFHFDEYAGCCSRLSGLTWGGEDLSSALGALTNRDESGQYTSPYYIARAMTLFAAAASRVDAVDAVYPNFRDLEGLKAECEAALRDGFVAKMAIHPQQIDLIHQVFTPSADHIAQAQGIVDAFERSGDAGVVSFEGRMLDAPHLINAKKVLKRAAFLGLL